MAVSSAAAPGTIIPESSRAANRHRVAASGNRNYNLGIRVGRTLSAGAGAITVAPGAH